LARFDRFFLGSNSAIAPQPEKMQIVSYGRDRAGAATLFNWGGTQSENGDQIANGGSSPLISASLTSLER
jgi:hypothetical protein